MECLFHQYSHLLTTPMSQRNHQCLINKRQYEFEKAFAKRIP